MNILVVHSIIAVTLLGAGLTTPKRYARTRLALLGAASGMFLGLMHSTNHGVD